MKPMFKPLNENPKQGSHYRNIVFDGLAILITKSKCCSRTGKAVAYPGFRDADGRMIASNIEVIAST